MQNYPGRGPVAISRSTRFERPLIQKDEAKIERSKIFYGLPAVTAETDVSIGMLLTILASEAKTQLMILDAGTPMSVNSLLTICSEIRTVAGIVGPGGNDRESFPAHRTAPESSHSNRPAAPAWFYSQRPPIAIAVVSPEGLIM